MAFPGGIVPGDVILPIDSELDYALHGHTFADTVFAGTIPMRKAAKLSVKPRTRKDVVQEDQVDMYDTMLDLECYGNSLSVLQTFYFLWRYGPNNFAIKDEQDTWRNYIANASGAITQGDATGSTDLSTMFTFEVGDVERSIKSKWEGGMYLAEQYWQQQNSGSRAVGNSGGPVVTGMNPMGYDPNNVAAPGILDVLVNDGSTTKSLGLYETGSKLTLDFHEQGQTEPRHQKLPGWLDIKGEIVMWQSAWDEQKYLFANQNKDITVTFVLAPAGINGAGGDTANLQIICVNSVKLAPEYDNDETKAVIKVAFNGRVRGADNIVFDLTANTLTLTRAAYV